MALEDFVEPEVGIAVALTAALASPRVRGLIRKGAVYGLAGILKAGDGIKAGATKATDAAKHTAGKTRTGSTTGRESTVSESASTAREPAVA